MASKITMPKLSPTMTSGIIAKWFVNVGDTVKAGDLLVEVETDKVSIDVEADHDGVIAEIFVNEGEEVAVDALIVRLAAVGTVIEAQTKSKSSEVVAVSKELEMVEVIDHQVAKSSGAPVTIDHDVNITPLARRMLIQEQLSVNEIKGTGAKGKITKKDIEQAIGFNWQALATSKNNQTVAFNEVVIDIDESTIPTHQKLPVSGMRQVVATRLTQSSRDIPHFYMSVDCNLDALMQLRQKLNDKGEGSYKLSVNDFVIKACAKAITKVPEANVMWAGDSILRFEQVDISLAVALPNGLITPVIRNAANLGLEAISHEAKALANLAKDGKLSAAQYQGGTFTISNLGMFGIKDFTSIINPPQNGILSVGAAESRAIVINGELSVGTMMTVTLGMDHRCVDGIVGARLMQAFKQFIEDPISLML